MLRAAPRRRQVLGLASFILSELERDVSIAVDGEIGVGGSGADRLPKDQHGLLFRDDFVRWKRDVGFKHRVSGERQPKEAKVVFLTPEIGSSASYSITSGSG